MFQLPRNFTLASPQSYQVLNICAKRKTTTLHPLQISSEVSKENGGGEWRHVRSLEKKQLKEKFEASDWSWYLTKFGKQAPLFPRSMDVAVIQRLSIIGICLVSSSEL